MQVFALGMRPSFRRIAQLTILAMVFMVVSGVAVYLIELWSGGRLERWRSAPFTGTVGDEFLAIQLAALPVVLAILACWAVVRIVARFCNHWAHGLHTSRCG